MQGSTSCTKNKKGDKTEMWVKQELNAVTVDELIGQNYTTVRIADNFYIQRYMTSRAAT